MVLLASPGPSHVLNVTRRKKGEGLVRYLRFVSGRALNHAADCSRIIQLAYKVLTNLPSVAENGQLHEVTFLLSWYDA
jgi:hypothetical protein